MPNPGAFSCSRADRIKMACFPYRRKQAIFCFIYPFCLRKCKVYGMNQSEMIRASLDKLVINPVIKFSPVNKELLSKIDELITEGKRIGNSHMFSGLVFCADSKTVWAASPAAIRTASSREIRPRV